MADDTITLVSTTDSLEDVQAALTGKPKETPPAEAETPAPEPKPETKPAETPAPPEPAPSETPEAAQAKKLSRGEKIQKEIDELTWRKNSVRKDVEAEETRLAMLRQQLAEEKAKTPAPPATPAPAAKPDPDAKPEPKLEAVDDKGNAVFATYEDFLSAHAKWSNGESERIAKKAIAEAQAADRARIEQEAATRVVNERIAGYNEKLETFKKTHADFDAAFEDAREVLKEPLGAIGQQALKVVDGFTIFDSEDGPALTYYLLKHPDDLKAIITKPPQQQLIQLARLEERLRASAAPKKTGPAPVVVPETKAPTPITPVSAGPTATTTPSLEDAEYQEFKRVRERQIRERRGA